MHLFMTFCTPHLGYMYHTNTLVETGNSLCLKYFFIYYSLGLWFLKTWKKSRCLSELSMTDSSKLENTYLYKLSESKVILFKLEDE